jgi:hypothetical protein
VNKKKTFGNEYFLPGPAKGCFTIPLCQREIEGDFEMVKKIPPAPLLKRGHTYL